MYVTLKGAELFPFAGLWKRNGGESVGNQCWLQHFSQKFPHPSIRPASCDQYVKLAFSVEFDSSPSPRPGPDQKVVPWVPTLPV